MNNKPLILWGGTDINPQLYFEEPHPMTDKPDNIRDNHECMEVALAIDAGKPIIGICRGAQLLCALNGGILDQHNPKHKNNSHPILTYDDKILKDVAADHHQVMIPSGNYKIFATSYDDYLPEVVWWPESRCLAVQPHPEWMPPSHLFNMWLNKLLVELNIDYKF